MQPFVTIFCCKNKQKWSLGHTRVPSLKRIITSAKDVMFYPAFVCLFVCYQLHKKTTDRILMKILPEMSLWTRNSLSSLLILEVLILWHHLCDPTLYLLMWICSLERERQRCCPLLSQIHKITSVDQPQNVIYCCFPRVYPSQKFHTTFIFKTSFKNAHIQTDRLT